MTTICLDSRACHDACQEVHDAIDLVMSMTDHDLKEAHDIMKNYCDEVAFYNDSVPLNCAKSILTQELTSKLPWVEDFITDILIDNDTSDVLDDMVSMNDLEEVEGAEEALSALLKTLHEQLFWDRRIKN